MSGAYRIYTKTKPDESLKRCYDCLHLNGYISTWCFNEDAIKYRGTRIPGVHGCPFWEPMREWKNLTKLQKIAAKLSGAIVFK